jgi:hypothetical protein
MDGPRLDDKAAPFQREAKAFVGAGLLRVNPDDQYTGRTQELHQPIKRRLKGPERAASPINQGHIILAGRPPAVCRRCCSNKAAAMQFKHHLYGLGAGYDDSVLFPAACKRDDRIDDSIAWRDGSRKSHDVTILDELLLAPTRAGTADRLRSASRKSGPSVEHGGGAIARPACRCRVQEIPGAADQCLA